MFRAEKIVDIFGASSQFGYKSMTGVVVVVVAFSVRALSAENHAFREGETARATISLLWAGRQKRRDRQVLRAVSGV